MKYLRDKIMFFLIALLSALIINFILPRMMPGDPAERILMKMGGEIQPEAVDAMKIALGVDKETPLLQQFFSYLKNTLTFNFGISYSYYPVP
ncbi:MAG: ABC transporter permease, partial [Defluviitoga tunisiensis]